MPKFLAPASQPLGLSLGLLVARVIAGYAMALHGLGKLQSEKGATGWMEGMGASSLLETLAPIAPFAELIGGGLLVLGLVTPVAALLVLGTMAGAISYHLGFGQPLVAVGGPSYELAALHFVIALIVLLAGPGGFSIDRFVFKR
jgi:putative oxidoreductase